jgi:hypothetical protein
MCKQIKTLTVMIILMPIVSLAVGVKKCQDANGQWHYGNYVASECVSENVTELLEDGRSVDVRVVLPTNEELAAEQLKEEEVKNAKIREEERKRIDAQLLRKYESEQNLINIRDKKLAELQKKKSFNTVQLQTLVADMEKRTKPKNDLEEQELHELQQLIGRYERAVAQTDNTIERTIDEFDQLLSRFRLIAE